MLAVSQRLFYWEGIRATGVDRIAAEAGVAPTALYRAFGSKDGLVTAYVEANAAGYRDFISAQTAPDQGTARERILELFDGVLILVQPDVCRGCPFLMTLSEFPDASTDAHRAAVATKIWVREHLQLLVTEFALELGGHDDQRTDGGRHGQAISVLADQLVLVLEGVYASVQALGASGPAKQARLAVEALMASFAARPSDRWEP